MEWTVTKRMPSGAPKAFEWNGVKVAHKALQGRGFIWRVTFPNGRTYHHDDHVKAMQYAEEHFERVMQHST